MSREMRWKILVTLFQKHKQDPSKYTRPEHLEELGGIPLRELQDQLDRLERDGYVKFAGIHNEPRHTSQITIAGRSLVEDAEEDALEPDKPPIGF